LERERISVLALLRGREGSPCLMAVGLNDPPFFSARVGPPQVSSPPPPRCFQFIPDQALFPPFSPPSERYEGTRVVKSLMPFFFRTSKRTLLSRFPFSGAQAGMVISLSGSSLCEENPPPSSQIPILRSIQLLPIPSPGNI